MYADRNIPSHSFKWLYSMMFLLWYSTCTFCFTILTASPVQYILLHPFQFVIRMFLLIKFINQQNYMNIIIQVNCFSWNICLMFSDSLFFIMNFWSKKIFLTMAGCHLIQVPLWRGVSSIVKSYTQHISLTWGTKCIYSQIWVFGTDQTPNKNSNCSPQAVSCKQETFQLLDKEINTFRQCKNAIPTENIFNCVIYSTGSSTLLM